MRAGAVVIRYRSTRTHSPRFFFVPQRSNLPFALSHRAPVRGSRQVRALRAICRYEIRLRRYNLLAGSEAVLLLRRFVVFPSISERRHAHRLVCPHVRVTHCAPRIVAKFPYAARRERRQRGITPLYTFEGGHWRGEHSRAVRGSIRGKIRTSTFYLPAPHAHTPRDGFRARDAGVLTTIMES